MRCLVTGVAGFLGSHVAERLLRNGHDVIGLDNMLGGDLENVPANVVFYQQDCNAASAALFDGVEVVYHFAAAPHEALSVFSPRLIYEHTLMSTVSVGTLAAVAGVRRIVFTSSAARYGHGPTTESWFVEPADPYGAAKRAAEEALLQICSAHAMEFAIAVPHNIIGTRQKYDDPYRNVVSIIMNRLLQGKPPIIYGDGTQTRCFTFVDDCVDALTMLGTRPDADRQLVNIGPDDNAVTINELVQQIREISGIDIPPVYYPDRPQEVKHVVVPATLARTWLGLTQHTDLRSGLEQMWHWLKARGPKPFRYHLPIEIDSPRVPEPWRRQLL
jgi:UDP-glucose 4-epimerase